MDIQKKLEDIEKHFANISPNQLEENLIKCGQGVIQPASKSGYQLKEPTNA